MSTRPNFGNLPVRDPDALDPANQSLAEALRKSFAVLKALMLVMVVAYALSGWFRVQPGEVGFVVRMGRVVGDRAATLLSPGWHWSFPYPIDQVLTVATQRERLVPASFMFQITEEDKIRGIRRAFQAPLSPLRDNYLITGDVNILHAKIVGRYRVADPVAYIAHVHDAAPGDEYPPEFEIMSDILQHAAIRTAAGLGVNDIYGAGQRDFLNLVAENARRTLADLDRAGQSLGIELIAVIAGQESGLEAILPPRQVQQEFDNVLSAEQQKIKAISEADGKASELLNRTAGPDHAAVSAAIDAEFEALLASLQADRDGSAEAGAKAAAALAGRMAAVDALLESATGEVQRIISEARTDRDRVVNEAVADHEQLKQMLGEYRRNGAFLMARLQTETIQEILTNPEIEKKVVPQSAKEYWLQVPRDTGPSVAELDEKEKKKDRTPPEGFINRNLTPGAR